MSGICGIVFKNRDCKVGPSLTSMLRALNRSEANESVIAHYGSIGIGAQRSLGRLSGVGEMTLQGQACGLAFHGNLYNMKELFPSGPTIENPFLALLQLYMNEGVEFLRLLRGEFAVAIWDGLKERLFLATDRFRVHPIFYYHDHSKFLFASRMRGIVACQGYQSRTVNPEAVVDVVAASMVPTPKTFFHEVQKLPPGHILTYHKGDVRLTSYWDIDFQQPIGASEAELAQTLREYFADAVSVRLAEDEPWKRIGAFLSGGIDSSTLTGVLTRLTNRKIKCFSIGFDQEQFNEISYARIAAQAFGAEHYQYFVTPADVYEAIPILMESFDEPFANASAVPTYFCAKFAKDHGVDILYAGDGGDELFAGNQRYADQRLFDYYYKIPSVLRTAFVAPFVSALADGLELTLFQKAKKYIQRASIPYPQRLTSYGFFHVFPFRELLTADFVATVGQNYDSDGSAHRYYNEALANTALDRQLYVDLKMTISDNDILKVIRMTEAAGVTARFPFLDHLLAEFAASVPAAIKMRGRRLRSFFKQAYAELLPVAVRSKSKHGFGVPIPIWLRTDKELNDLMHETVLSPKSVQRGYFRSNALKKLVELHKADETSFYGTILWNLMVLEMWQRKWLDSGADLDYATGHTKLSVSNK